MQQKELKDNLLIHLHVPKTGGTTMRSIVMQQFNQSEIVEVYPEWGIADSINQIHDITQHEKSQIKCLQGHFVYGVHVYFDKPVHYMAMLRDPVEQVISTYYYIKGKPNHPYHQDLIANDITLHNFDQWSSQHIIETTNAQTRFMSGVASRKLKPEDLETAKRNVQDKFALVGLTERFDESLFLLNKIFNWKVFTYKNQNITAVRPKQHELPVELVNHIRETNKLDVELYSFVRDLFNRTIESLDTTTRGKLEDFLGNCEHYRFIQSCGKNLISEQFLDWINNNNNSQVYIFGASEGGVATHDVIKAMNERFNSNIQIRAFIDNDENKKGKLIKGIPIISARSVELFRDSQIVIASTYMNEIEKQLRSLLIPKNNIVTSLTKHF